MAKLNGVKTIDMVNGDITKIAYEGVEYVKTNEKVQVGDIVLSIGDRDAAKGNFYIAVKGNYELPAIYDDAADYRVNLSSFIVFRKVPTYVKISKDDAQPGDFVTYKEAPEYYLESGRYYEITRIDGWGNPQIIDDEGDEYDTYEGDFEVYRKVGKVEEAQEIITHNGKKYRKLGAVTTQKGDLVKFHNSHRRTKAGKLYEVLERDHYIGEDNYREYSTEGWGGLGERDVYRPIVSESITHKGNEYVPVDREAKAGDIVVYPDINVNFIKNGKPYLVDDGGYITDEDGDVIIAMSISSGRTSKNTLVYEPKHVSLRVGDFAKVVPHNNTNFFGGKPGDIVKIVRVNSSGSYEVEELDGGHYGGAPNELKEALVKATEEEVAAAKLETKLAKLGRKPGEFKDGDIVECTDSHSGHPIGTIGVVSIDSADADFVHVIANGRIRIHSVKLISPVESHVDIA